MLIWTYLLGIVHTTASQNIYYSSWNTLFILLVFVSLFRITRRNVRNFLQHNNSVVFGKLSLHIVTAVELKTTKHTARRMKLLYCGRLSLLFLTRNATLMVNRPNTTCFNFRMTHFNGESNSGIMVIFIILSSIYSNIHTKNSWYNFGHSLPYCSNRDDLWRQGCFTRSVFSPQFYCHK